MVIEDLISETITIQRAGKGIPMKVLQLLEFLDFLLTCYSMSSYSGIIGRPSSDRYLFLLGISANFRSRNHRIDLVESTSVILRNFDDKRFYLECGLHSRPHGHFKNSINSHCEFCLK